VAGTGDADPCGPHPTRTGNHLSGRRRIRSIAVTASSPSGRPDCPGFPVDPPARTSGGLSPRTSRGGLRRRSGTCPCRRYRPIRTGSHVPSRRSSARRRRCGGALRPCRQKSSNGSGRRSVRSPRCLRDGAGSRADGRRARPNSASRRHGPTRCRHGLRTRRLWARDRPRRVPGSGRDGRRPPRARFRSHAGLGDDLPGRSHARFRRCPDSPSCAQHQVDLTRPGRRWRRSALHSRPGSARILRPDPNWQRLRTHVRRPEHPIRGRCPSREFRRRSRQPVRSRRRRCDLRQGHPCRPVVGHPGCSRGHSARSARISAGLPLLASTRSPFNPALPRTRAPTVAGPRHPPTRCENQNTPVGTNLHGGV
jgi:hypothetical protein